MKVPGPGTYGVSTQINPTGKSHVSTVPSSKAANWSPNKVRFVEDYPHSKHVPGPGAYEIVQQISKTSRLSTVRNAGSPRIQQDITRDSNKIKSNNVPGPGSYKLPSEFGTLDFHKIKKTRHKALDQSSEQTISPRQ